MRVRFPLDNRFGWVVLVCSAPGIEVFLDSGACSLWILEQDQPSALFGHPTIGLFFTGHGRPPLVLNKGAFLIAAAFSQLTELLLSARILVELSGTD